MEVENTGDQAQMLDSSSLYTYIDGQQYSASSDAVMADKLAEVFFLQDINPRQQRAGHRRLGRACGPDARYAGASRLTFLRWCGGSAVTSATQTNWERG